MNLFDIASLKLRLNELEDLILQDGFWNDSVKSKQVLNEIKSIKLKVVEYDRLYTEIANIEEISEIIVLENDIDMAKEVIRNTSTLLAGIDRFEVTTLLSGKYDKNNAIITIHPGARWN